MTYLLRLMAIRTQMSFSGGGDDPTALHGLVHNNASSVVSFPHSICGCFILSMHWKAFVRLTGSGAFKRIITTVK